MPVRSDIPAGDPCWIELFTTDADRTSAFYDQLFGWTVVTAAERYGEADYGGYFNFAKDGHMVAGCMRNDGSMSMPDAWSVYLAVTDAEATAAAATAAGAQVYLPPMPVMELGSMSVLGDPGGAAIGIWQPGLHRGFEISNEPGTPVWFELHTKAYDASVEFYRTVFAWDTHVAADEPGFRYTTLGDGDNQRAGVMDAAAYLPENAPSTWAIYFGTTDTDASVAEARSLGGNVVQPAEDTPYGRLATLTDPCGAYFKLLGPNVG
jgi:uncharacterized protein